MGANNQLRRLAGRHGTRDVHEAEVQLQYDAFVSMEEPDAGAVNTRAWAATGRASQSVCGPIKNLKKENAFRIDQARTTFADVLTTLPGAHHIVVAAINDDAIEGALAAAKTAGRTKDLYVSGQGADPSSWCDIQSNPQWVGDTAYFPERYGEIGVPYLIKAIKGETIPKNLLVPHEIINAANIGSIYQPFVLNGAHHRMSIVVADPAPAAFMLRARGVRKSFAGTEVLHGVDVDIVGGRVLALLGENGAGKSTLVRVVAGAHAPDAGTLEFTSPDGEVDTVSGLDPFSARRRGIRMIFQELSDAPDLTVAENISLGHWPARRGLISWRAMRKRAGQVLSSMGVDLDLDAMVGSLRIGERQIVEIARALSDDATCLVLDEPTAALSSDEVERLFGFVRRLRDQSVALVYITHRLDEVAAIADDVVVLRDGRSVGGRTRPRGSAGPNS